MKNSLSLFLGLCVAALPMLSLAAQPTTSGTMALTAFQARPVAEKQLSDQAKGKLIQISSIRSHSTRPSQWRFIFWDPFAAQNCRAITITNGKVSEIREGYVEADRLRLAAYKQEEVLDGKRLKVDSDQALARLMSNTLLKDIHLSAATFHLSKAKSPIAPIWVINLYAEKNGKEIDLGKAKISSETGEIFEMALKLDRLNDK